MPKNILIFSDGTGQAGGLRPDQNLSNVYKLYRACRTGPESPIDPAEQISFYDAGLGTENDEGKIPFRPLQKLRKLWSSVTGIGISRNIADCYAAILKHYEPGDRIFLFGFSRGAYTARCVGGVMSLCGIPTHGGNGTPLPRYGRSLRQIADEAVQQVYEHGAGSDTEQRRQERLEKARRFREKYGSQNAEGVANVVPYFIGVFDTVAALGAPGPRRILLGLGLTLFITAVSVALAFVLSLISGIAFGVLFAMLFLGSLLSLGISYFRSHFKSIRNFPQQGNFRWHFAAWRFRFYDNNLNARVRYARHAMAIDEDRKDFDRVPWGSVGDHPERLNEPEWLRQVWFSGNHSDIGGSYAEDESRLSDISLEWMVGQATELPHPVLFDRSKMRLYPSPDGMQHCEIQAMREIYPGWWPRALRFTYARRLREVPSDAPLHPTVIARFENDNVLHFGIGKSYRPENLRLHNSCPK